MHFLEYPIQFEQLINGNNHNRCGLKQSVAEYINLVVTTVCGELSYAPDYGCTLWDYEFDNVIVENELRVKIKDSIFESINNLEYRITLKKVRISFQDVDIPGNTRVKKQLNMRVEAVLKQTGEQITIYDHFFISPFSQ